MFISTGKINGVPYLRVMEGYTVKGEKGTHSQSRQVLNLGPLEKYDDGQPDFISRLRASFKAGSPLIKELEPYSQAPKETQDYIELKNLSSFILEPIFNQLGIRDVLTKYKSNSKISYDLNGLTKLLVFGRLLDPNSKLKTFEQNENYFAQPANEAHLSDVYKALDVLDLLSSKIQTRMNTKITKGSVGRETSHVFYDVTNYFYETADNDEDQVDEVTGEVIKAGFRKRGVSKEHRPQPLTQMGLFIDDNGLPISYKLFPGNCTDQTTFRPALRETIDNYKLGRVIVVADRGLNNDKNIAHLLQKGNGYVISKSLKKNKPEVRQWILDQEGYCDEEGQAVTDEANFKVKSRIVEREITDEKGQRLLIKEKQVVYWSKAHYLREAHQNKVFLKYLDSVIDFPDKIKDKQAKIEHYLKTSHVDQATGEIVKVKKVRTVDEQKVQEFVDLMGYYLITTSEVSLSNSKIIGIYHGLSRIEDSFRITKSTLEGRPIFVRSAEHINAHFLICFIALTMLRLLQYKVLSGQKLDTKVKLKKERGEQWWTSGMTAEEITKMFKAWSLTKMSKSEYKLNQPTAALKLLGNILGLELAPIAPDPEQINKLKSTLSKIDFV
jgi:transposase